MDTAAKKAFDELDAKIDAYCDWLKAAKQAKQRKKYKLALINRAG